MVLGKFFHRLRLRWRARGWKLSDHDDCISFIGFCDRCRARIELNSSDPDVVARNMHERLMKHVVVEDIGGVEADEERSL
jgi:hypothetical protein